MKAGVRNLSVSLVLLMAACAPLLAQPETLFGDDLKSGGFGGLSLKVTNVNTQLGMLAGGGGAWVINSSFYIGGGGYGLVTDHTTLGLDVDTTRIMMGYGGGIIGVQFAPDKLIHFGAHTLIGGGGVGHRKNDGGSTDHPRDMFFVIEPTLVAELNFTRNVRVAFEGSYRLISGVNLPGTTDKDLSGPAAGVMIRVGAF